MLDFVRHVYSRRPGMWRHMRSPWKRLAHAIHLTRRVRADKSALDLGPTEVLARIAHEARQPLSAARAAFQIVRYCPQDQRRERACVVLDRQLVRLTRLLDDLLEASRLRLGLTPLQLQQVDLCHLVSDVADSMALQAENKHQRLDLQLPRDPVWVHADSARLEQVVSNLLVNGVRYTDPGGRVLVGVTRDPREAVLTVADNGRGISRDLLPHLFEPFTKGDAAGEGLGVGLAIARQIVELHGGTIQASSAGPGSGSEFTVTLPISASEHTTPPTTGGSSRQAFHATEHEYARFMSAVCSIPASPRWMQRDGFSPRERGRRCGDLEGGRSMPR